MTAIHIGVGGDSDTTGMLRALLTNDAARAALDSSSIRRRPRRRMRRGLVKP